MSLQDRLRDEVISVETTSHILDVDGASANNHILEDDIPYTKVYKTSSGLLTVIEIIEMLTNPKLELVSNMPPMHPKANQVYVITNEGDKLKDHDWACDGYMWENRNGHPMQIKNRKEVVWGQTYHIRETSKGELDKVLRTKSYEPVVLSYDTTFELGDFYMSVLVAKHTLFKGGKTFPVAFLIHDRKVQYLHERFWRTVIKLIPSLKKSNYVIVVDREIAFQNVLSELLPNANVVLCWNHIKCDLLYKLKKHGAKSDDIVVYTQELDQLLHASDEQSFDILHSEFSSRWSQPVFDYVESMSEVLKTKACRWVLEKFEVYDPYSGITNNICKSINATIKRLSEWREAPVDAMILSMHYLQQYFKFEILRGRCGIGEFKLKYIHSNAQLDRE